MHFSTSIKSFSIGIAAAALVAAVPASAATVVASLPDFDGPLNTGGFPVDLGVVGTFAYSLPGSAVITSATLSGTYGTAAFSASTAGFDASVDGTTLTVCVPLDPGCWVNGAAFRPFSFVLPGSSFASLLDGMADLRIIQTNGNFVRFGSPTLTIDYTTAGVPEPSTWLMMLAGFGMIGFGIRNRRSVRVQFA